MKGKWVILGSITIGLFLDFSDCSGQRIELASTEFKDDKLLVHYSLIDSLPGRSYTVRLYGSRDNFLNPLEKVTGAVGLEVKPGGDNLIVWDVRSELGPLFQGAISLELRARPFVPFINTEGINQYNVFKKKRKYNLTWNGGGPQNVLNFDLYKGERKITSFPNIANVGHHTIQFPSYIKPGKGYRFRISDYKNPEDVVYTESFQIKQRIPLVLKILPLAIVGYASYYLLTRDSGAGNEEIADPPKNFEN